MSKLPKVTIKITHKCGHCGEWTFPYAYCTSTIKKIENQKCEECKMYEPKQQAGENVFVSADELAIDFDMM